MKQILYILFVTILFISCKTSTNSKIKFSKIVYHLGRCRGDCPSINVEIDSARNIIVDREYSETDTTYNGKYRGVLTQKQYQHLLNILQNTEIETLVMDTTIVYDVAITTLIVYCNGIRYYFKSAKTTGREYDLLVFLKSVGEDKALIKTKEIIDMKY